MSPLRITHIARALPTLCARCHKGRPECSHVECPRRRPLTAAPPGYRDWEALPDDEENPTDG